MRLQLEGELPELTATLSGEGDLPAPVRFPHPFRSDPGTHFGRADERRHFLSGRGQIYFADASDCLWRPWHLHGLWGATDGEKVMPPSLKRRMTPPFASTGWPATFDRSGMGPAKAPLWLRAPASLRVLRSRRARNYLRTLSRLRARKGPVKTL